MPASPTPQVKALIKAVPLFSDLSARDITAVSKLAKSVTHHAGSEVAAQGRGSLAFHVIANGSATVSVNGKLRRTLSAGDYFGEMSLLDGEPRSASVVAGPDGLTTLALTRSVFLGLVEKEPTLSRALITALCGRIRALEQSS